MKAFRVDRASTLRKPERTSHGFLRVDGHVARPGIYEYTNTTDDERDGLGKAGTIRRELRPEEEIAKSIAGYSGATLTLGHPRKLNGDFEKVTAANVRAVQVGDVVSARMDGDLAAADLIVKDAKAIRAVEAGTQELSPGTELEYDPTPGVHPKYGRYDGVQRNITINHLALVDRARGGHALRLRMDGFASVAEERCDGDLNAAARHQLAAKQFAVPEREALPIEDAGHVRDAMARFGQEHFQDAAEKSRAYHRIVARAKEIGIDAAHFVSEHGVSMRADQIDRSGDAREGARMADEDKPADVAEKLRLQTVRADEQERIAAERHDALEVATRDKAALQARLDSANETIADLNARIAAGATAVETEAVRALTERAETAEREIVKMRERRDGEIRERCSIMTRAQAVMGAKFRVDGLSNREICAQVVKHLRPKEDVSASVSDAYLQSRFDSLIEARMANDASYARAGAVLAQTTQQHREDGAAANNKSLAWADQWKAGAGEFSTRKEP